MASQVTCHRRGSSLAHKEQPIDWRIDRWTIHVRVAKQLRRALPGASSGSMTDLSAIELNEAFATQSLAVLRHFGVPDDAQHVNAHGGAIALGYQLGMSGARLALTLVHSLQKMVAASGLLRFA
jgi:acetyl-CoA acetyltransferase